MFGYDDDRRPFWISLITALVISILVCGGFWIWHDEFAQPRQVSSGNVQEQSENAYNDVKNSVVSVINMKKQPKTIVFGGMILHRKSNAPAMRAMSEGSGIVYKISHGSAYIVTNNHVVNGSSKLRVILSSGKRINAKEIGSNAANDLAVIKVGSGQINQSATFGNSSRIEAGETALAIGSPMGSQYASSLTRGIISAKKRKVTENGQNNTNLKPTKQPSFDVIQTDAPINPGNSGGPLINLAGQVIGINSMKLSMTPQGGSVEGIGFAIPSNKVVRIVNQIMSNN